MSRQSDRFGRPRRLDENWDKIFNQLPGAFWSHKGISGTCPNCLSESSQGKMKFLIRFEQGKFKSYGCFKCNFGGSGFGGISRLARQIGVQLSPFEIGAMVGQDEAISGDGIFIGHVGDEEEVGAIQWPPSWIEETDEVFLRGLEYVRSRGFPDPAAIVDRFELMFSEKVEINYSGDRFLKDFPCVVAPMVGSNKDTFGWITRRLGPSTDPDEPKSIDASGKKWKTMSMFGLRQIRPEKPVTVVEGMFSSLSTPNSVAVGGKTVSNEQIALLADTGASVFVFALDPGVPKEKFADVMYRLSMRAAGARVFNVEWDQFGGDVDRDPNDRGKREMEEIVTRTILKNMRS